MNAYHRGAEVLSRLNDAELLEAYRRYVTRLESILSPEELELYVAWQQTQQRSQATQRPEEYEVSAKVEADAEAVQLYERYLGLLANHQASAEVTR